MKFKAFCAIFLLASCSFKPEKEDSVGLRIQLPRDGSFTSSQVSAQTSNTFNGPSFASIDCYAINVFGPGISGPTGNGSEPPQCSYAGIVSKVIPNTQTELFLKVPAGPSRTIQVIGLKMNAGVTCGNGEGIEAYLGAGSGNATLVELGRTKLDLFRDSRVVIANSYDSLKAQSPFRCDSAAPLLGYTNNLKLWLKADAISGVASGGSVSTWSDSSGQGNDVFQATSTSQPTLQASSPLPVIRFDGSDDYLERSSVNTIETAANLLDAVTFFVVTRVNTLTASSIVFGASSSSSFTASTNKFFKIELSGASVFQALFNYPPSTQNTLATSEAATGALKLHAVRWQVSSPGNYWVNGTQLASITGFGNSLDVHQAIFIGGPFTSFYNGDIAEILVYTEAMSATNMGVVNCYLNGRYNLGFSGC